MTVADIRQLIAAGDLDEAQRRLGAQAVEGPLGADYRLLEADLLQKRGDASGAIDVLRDLAREAPGQVGVQVRLLRLLRQAGKLDEARDLFLRHVWKTGYSLEEQDRLVNQLSSGADALAEPTLAFLDHLVDGAATRRTVLIRRGTFLSRLNRADEALAMFEQAIATDALPPYAATIHFDLLVAAGRMAEAREAARALMEAEPNEPRHPEKVAAAAAAEGRLDIAAEVMETALARHPTDWWLLFRFNRLAFAPEVVDRLFAVMAGNAANRTADPRGAFQYALAALEQDRLAEACGLLEQVYDDPAACDMARPLLGALRWLESQALNPKRFADSRQADARVLRCPGADTTLLLFGGVMARFGYLPMSLIDRLLSLYRVNIVYLNDPYGIGYLRGVPHFGADQAQTVAGLRDLCTGMGSRIVTLGGSIGGTAAGRYGAMLGADAALSLGGPVVLDPQADLSGVPQHVRASMAKLPRIVDLRDQLRDAPDMRLVYVHSAGRPQHHVQLQYLRKCPGLISRPMATATSFTAMQAVADGLLPEFLERDLGLERL